LKLGKIGVAVLQRFHKEGEKKMDTMEERLRRLEFYQSLLIEMIDGDKYPFYKLVMQLNLSEEEVHQLFLLCEELSIEYEKQKAEGFVIFNPLLTQFAGMLPPKLDVEETIYALYKQGLFTPLMEEFQHILKEMKREL
jgi:hypothetical protein